MGFGPLTPDTSTCLKSAFECGQKIMTILCGGALKITFKDIKLSFRLILDSCFIYLFFSNNHILLRKHFQFFFFLYSNSYRLSIKVLWIKLSSIKAFDKLLKFNLIYFLE